MIIDLFAILFIIILSSCLCYSDKDYKCQMSHIILGLSVIVFYKVIKLLRAKYSTDNNSNLPSTTTKSVENFDINTEMSNFISSGVINEKQFEKLDPTQYNEYKQKIDTLQTSLKNIENQLASYSVNKDTPALSPSSDRYSIESIKNYQNFQIGYLNDQIAKAKQLMNDKKIEEQSKQYKRIKVYSSCVMSNADGSTTVEKPVPSNNNIQGLTPNSNVLSQAASNLLTTISQSNKF